jgi:hypothetical protein
MRWRRCRRDRSCARNETGMTQVTNTGQQCPILAYLGSNGTDATDLRHGCQYFPKGTDLSRWTAWGLEAVALALNNCPRKTLGRKTPAEVFDDHLRSLQQPGVATTL